MIFADGSGDQGSIPGPVIPKTKKWYLISPCLTLRIITYGSRVSSAIPGKEKYPPLHLGVTAIEKGALDYGQPTYIYIYIYIYTLYIFYNSDDVKKCNCLLIKNIGQTDILEKKFYKKKKIRTA